MSDAIEWVEGAYNSRTVTVRQLVAWLSALPDQSLPVVTEGCDCTGDISHLREDAAGYGRAIMIGRPGAPISYEEPIVLLAGDPEKTDA